MKKILVVIACFYSVLSFSQLTMKKLDGTPILNGDVLTFNTLGNAEEAASSDPAYLGLKIYNSSASNINVKMRLISMVNADGNNLQFCIDPICVGTLTVGNAYPASGSSIIPANGQNGNFDHFINANPGTGSGNVEYVLKFYMVNSFGAEIGNSITFTYRYAVLGVQTNALANAGINVKSTLVKSQLEFDANANGTAELYDVNGRMISSLNYISGYNYLDVSNLNAAVYIVNFTTEEGKKAALKIIKK
ncbi:T9SS type A sorting domain-containing protein [Flavobacterium wongokense]|uniref:T9SS type A sorting domain-containing protein n=1 Tax=Flavobacterium wongokense TaxID=2910674 RepID=UPI001F3AD494|nr:T9SS type A sorting domain-containing protein [Flavobacterium sp. WG47]MCF6131253.1 T9SS type A sorting domain-containing protein [Flavobacterium sp. WG47]